MKEHSAGRVMIGGRRTSATAHARRGAILLLVLLILVPLFLLWAVSLTRTLNELQAAQRFLAHQQAFHLAEGALDVALAQLRFEQQRTLAQQRGHLQAFRQTQAPAQVEALQEQHAYTALDTPIGLGVFQVSTESVVGESSLLEREVYRIESIGVAASGIRSTITAHARLEGPLRGILAEGPIVVIGGYHETTFGGSLRTTLGTSSAITIVAGVHVQGPVRIGPPSATTQRYQLFDGQPQPAYDQLVHHTPAGAVYLKEGLAIRPIMTGSVMATRVDRPQPIVLPYPSEACELAVNLREAGRTVEIADGVENPKLGLIDFFPDDGKVTLCLRYLYAHAAGVENQPRIIFHAPATVYLTAANDEGVALKAHDLYAVDQAGTLIPDGVHILVTGVEGHPAGAVVLDPSQFGGSIIAPQSLVLIERGFPQTGPWFFGGLVAREIVLWMAGRHVTFSDTPVNAPFEAAHPYHPNRVAVKLISWTN